MLEKNNIKSASVGPNMLGYHAQRQPDMSAYQAQRGPDMRPYQAQSGLGMVSFLINLYYLPLSINSNCATMLVIKKSKK